MNERLKNLDEALKKLESGKIDSNTLNTAVQLAREIYEQWVIVKHEFQLDELDDPIKESFKEIKIPIKNTFKKDEVIESSLKEPEGDYAEDDEDIGPDAPQNQTTLIDIIEEIQEDQTINDRISKGKTKESLAQKHAKKAISNIEKSIGLNQRFSFIKNLFENDKEAYNEAVGKLNSCASFLEADDFIHNKLMEKYNWDENTVHVIKFIELIERRYLPH